MTTQLTYLPKRFGPQGTRYILQVCLIMQVCLILQGTSYILPAERETFDWLAFPLQHPRRAELLQHLESNNIQAINN